MNGSNDAPQGLLESGRPPRTRMENAAATQDRIALLIRADDQGRSKRRALVKGLVDGNPPYRYSDLKNAGRADVCNVNWRIAESFLNNAINAFYDVFSEVPTYATVKIKAKDPVQSQDKSGIVTEEFHRLLSRDRSWDYTMQNSQYETVLYGIGPLLFEDEYDWRNISTECKDLLVPEYAKSDITKWEEMVVLMDYAPHQLYDRIVDPSAAGKMGWNVPATRKAIINAHPVDQNEATNRSWEWYQTRLKTQSFHYSAESNAIQTAHYYIKEFSGKITHSIVLSPTSKEPVQEYLFQKIGRFDDWEQVIHPMYYDNLGGGKHHAVTGMGIKMYSALEFQNRLICNLADKTFAPKIVFRPTTAQGGQQLSLVRMGDYMKTNDNWEAQQLHVNGMLDEGMAFNREVGQLVAANLSAYRQNLQKTDGNPLTATEVSQRAAEQARLGKTQLNRYYNQLDWVYSQKYTRAANASSASLPGGKEALEFQKRCKDRGVTLAELRDIESVHATRVVGQGSDFLRQMALEFLLGLVSMLPESGRTNLVRDVIASRAGQRMVDRYYPVMEKQETPDDQLAFAMLQVSAMKDGIAPVVTDTQDHIKFAQTFLQAGAEALQSIQKGANPADVLGFLNMAGPAIKRHIDMMAADPTRKNEVKALTEQWNQLAKATDQLQKRLDQMMQQRVKSQQQQQQVMNEQQLKEFETRKEQSRKDYELRAEDRRRNQKIKQQIASKDLQLQQKIRANTIDMAQSAGRNSNKVAE